MCVCMWWGWILKLGGLLRTTDFHVINSETATTMYLRDPYSLLMSKEVGPTTILGRLQVFPFLRSLFSCLQQLGKDTPSSKHLCRDILPLVFIRLNVYPLKFMDGSLYFVGGQGCECLVLVYVWETSNIRSIICFNKLRISYNHKVESVNANLLSF